MVSVVVPGNGFAHVKTSVQGEDETFTTACVGAPLRARKSKSALVANTCTVRLDVMASLIFGMF
jgi:hypothetical protein